MIDWFSNLLVRAVLMMYGKPSLKLFCLSACCLFASDVTASEPFIKVKDNHIRAQALVNEAVSKSTDLIALGLHAKDIKAKKLKLVASNLDQIGKFDDITASNIVRSKRILLIPNQNGFRKYEIQMPLTAADGRILGWLDFLYKYDVEPDPVALLSKSLKIRDKMVKNISSEQSLFEVDE